jgi:excinuclease UvrABC ATPase subunit
VVACGTPEQVMRSRRSYTGQALAKVLRNGNARRRATEQFA